MDMHEFMDMETEMRRRYRAWDEARRRKDP
jgi:hypothetical protein